jgi:uncharacterized RDD family membrane protein YckC
MGTTTTAPRYGGFWIRVVAFILDAIVISVLTGALAPILGMPVIEPPPPIPTEPGLHINIGTGGATSGLIGLLYFVGFWALRGQTPGQIAFGLRVVRAVDGTRPDVVLALLRYVGLIISFAVLLLGVIWVAFDGRKQGWHDKLAGTVVVRSPAPEPATR